MVEVVHLKELVSINSQHLSNDVIELAIFVFEFCNFVALPGSCCNDCFLELLKYLYVLIIFTNISQTGQRGRQLWTG